MACIFHRYVGLFSIRWLKLAILFAITTASHGFLDAFTDAGYGIGFFIPFDNSRYFFPWRPLKTSPIGITSFFNGNALAIMKNEIIWVWLPVLILGGITWIVRRSTRAA
jgi:inner membrane protein